MMSELQTLRVRVAELEEELRQMREDCAKTDWFIFGNLSKQQSALLFAINQRSVTTYEQLDYVTEDHGKYNRYEGEMHQTLRTKVAVWKLRKKLELYGVKIKTLRGIGYYLDDENKAKLKQLMEKKDVRTHS